MLSCRAQINSIIGMRNDQYAESDTKLIEFCLRFDFIKLFLASAIHYIVHKTTLFSNFLALRLHFKRVYFIETLILKRSRNIFIESDKILCIFDWNGVFESNFLKTIDKHILYRHKIAVILVIILKLAYNFNTNKILGFPNFNNQSMKSKNWANITESTELSIKCLRVE